MPVAPDDILRSCEVKQSVCARNTTSLSVIHSLIQAAWSDVRFSNESFFWTGYFYWTSEHRSTSYSIKSHFWTWLIVSPTQHEPKYQSIWSHDAGFCQLIRRSSYSNSHWIEETFQTRTEDQWSSDMRMQEPSTYMKGQIKVLWFIFM